jgi:hypothetical protein
LAVARGNVPCYTEYGKLDMVRNDTAWAKMEKEESLWVRCHKILFFSWSSIHAGARVGVPSDADAVYQVWLLDCFGPAAHRRLRLLFSINNWQD